MNLETEDSSGVRESFSDIGRTLARETRLCQGYGVAGSVSG